MKHLKSLLFLALIGPACVVGSSTVRYQDGAKGVLVLEGDEGQAMESAQKRMAQHCGVGNYRIVKRETVKVGTENYSDTSTAYDESTNRARDEQSVAVADSDTVSGNTSSTDHDAWSSDHSSDSYSSTTSEAAAATREDENIETVGGSSTSTRSGVRDVNEVRLHYVCGGMQQPPAPTASAPTPATDPAAAPAPATPAPAPVAPVPADPAPAPTPQ